MAKGKTKAQLELELQTAQVQIATLKYQLELHGSHELFRNLFNLSPVAYSLSQDGVIVDINPACEDLYGYAKEEVIGRQITALDIWVEPGEFHKVTEQFLRDGELRNFELAYKTKSGLAGWVLSSANWIDQGKEKYILSEFVNITERKRTEEFLKQSELKYSALFEKSAVPAALTKMPEGVFADVNQAFQATYGYTREEVIGKTSVEIGMTRPEERSETYANLQKFGTLHDNEKHLFTKFGEARIGSVNINKVFIQAEEYVITTIHDVTERKQIEAELLQSQDNFFRAFESNPAALAITRRADGKFIRINQAYSAIMGYGSTELIGHNVNDFSIYVHPQEREQLLQTMTEQGAVHNYELTVRDRNDNQRQILVSMEPLLYDLEECLISAFVDISDRKRTEAALRESEERFTNVFQTSPVAQSITIAETGEIMEVNAAFCELFGYARTELIGNSTKQLNLWEQPNERAAAIEQLRATGHVYGQETTIRSRLGEVRSVLVSVEPIIWQGRSCAISSSLDITQRKRAEERLAYQSNLLANVYDAIVGTDANFHVTYWNKAAEEIFGWTAEEVLGQATTELLKTQFLNSSREQTLQGLMESGQYDGELRYARKSGEYFEAHVRSVVLKDEQGHSTGLVSSIRDITARKLMEEELRRSNAELEQFAYVASHDLQEPLRAVAGMVHLLGQRYKGQLDARADEYISHAVEAASRMQALISDLLAYSRVERRNNPIELVSAEDCLQAALKNLSVLVRETHATITADSLPSVHADTTQLIQLFQNLIGNGIKFRGANEPQVSISVIKLEGAWQFSVHDNGIGIDSEYFERIFLVFQRLHTRREYAGTGIGLAICKKIVERHGGQIWVESIPGSGSTFYFTLPIRNTNHDTQPRTQTH